MIRVGKPAPNFATMAYQDGNFSAATMEDYKGKWVFLFFYPGDFTFVWVTEVAVVAAKFEEFNKLGVQVLGISMDSVFVHKMWDEQELSKSSGAKLPFPLLSDPCGDIGKLYGVFTEEGNINLRGSFIIDPEGIVQSMEVVSAPVGRDFDEAIRKLAAHKFVSENQGKAAPCSWTPGKAVLEPKPELVGKVVDSWKIGD